jgi:hypothetical protein
VVVVALVEVAGAALAAAAVLEEGLEVEAAAEILAAAGDSEAVVSVAAWAAPA